MNGIDLSPSNQVKLLGVTFDEKLNFDAHVDIICKKASRQISAISRIAKFLSQECILKMYHSFVRSNFLYCANVWHFGSFRNFRKIEKVNKRALRLVLNDYTSSYPELLSRVNQQCIFVQNLHVILCECFKYVNVINPSILDDVFIFMHHEHNTRGVKKLHIPLVNTITHGTNSFRFQAPKLWNMLDDKMKLARDISEFKNNIKEWKPSCACGNCNLCLLHLI